MKLNLNRNKRYAIPIMTHPGIELIEKTVKAAVTDGQTCLLYTSDAADE